MTAAATATITDNTKLHRVVVKVPASVIEFPYKDEPQRTAQIAAAHKYLADAQKAGMKLKIREEVK